MTRVILGTPESLVLPISVLRAIADRLVAVAPEDADAGLLNGMKVGLFVNDVTPTKNSVLADFTEPDFTGYAKSAALTFGAAFEDDAGRALLVASNAQFVATASPAEEVVVRGYFLTDGAGTGFKGAERFAEEVRLNESGEGLVVIPRYTLPRL